MDTIMHGPLGYYAPHEYRCPHDPAELHIETTSAPAWCRDEVVTVFCPGCGLTRKFLIDTRPDDPAVSEPDD
jgi:hypothetical protein